MPGEPGLLGGAEARRRRARRPRAGAVLGERGRRRAREPRRRAQLEMMRNMLLAMDPPRHVDYRRPLAPALQGAVIGAMDDQIRAICREIMANAPGQRRRRVRARRRRRRCPSQVIGQLMGLPAGGLGRCIHRVGRDEHERPGRRVSPAATSRVGDAQRSTWRCTRSSSPARRRAEPRPRRPHDADARRPTSTAGHDDRHRLRQLLRAARHRRQRHDEDDAGVGPARAARAPRPAGGAARRPVARSRARSRRSCATPTRCTTSGAPRPPTPSCATRRSRPATRSR